MLTGWFGVGTAIQAYLENGCENSPATPEERLGQLKEMVQVWPFFRALMSNMEQVLAKTDLDIARQYATLVPNARLRDKVFNRIQAEFHLTHSQFAQVCGHPLLQNDQVLRDALSERFAYIDPLNHLQVELLRRHRKSGRKAGRGGTENSAQRAIHMTINGIAAGLRNSG
jgi:phosphoenolpyruvate carboxylase